MYTLVHVCQAAHNVTYMYCSFVEPIRIGIRIGCAQCTLYAYHSHSVWHNYLYFILIKTIIQRRYTSFLGLIFERSWLNGIPVDVILWTGAIPFAALSKKTTLADKIQKLVENYMLACKICKIKSMNQLNSFWPMNLCLKYCFLHWTPEHRFILYVCLVSTFRNPQSGPFHFLYSNTHIV